VLVKPPGKDPDDVIRSSPEVWARLVDEAQPLLDYVFDAAARRRDLSSPAERSLLAQQLVPWLQITGDRILQSHYLQQLARITQTDEATLRLDMRQPVQRQNVSPEAKEKAQRFERGRDKKEEFCLALLFRYPELLAEGIAIDGNLFGYSENRALFETWVGWTEGGEPFEDLLDADLHPQYERILNISLPAYDDETLVKALHSTVWGMEQQRLKLAKRASGAALAQVARDAGADIAERARVAWERREPNGELVEGDADPVAAFVEDMEAGLQVHQRLLDQRRRPGRAEEVVNDG
jgi:DNA primase